MKKSWIDVLVTVVLSAFLIFLVFQGLRMLYYIWFK